MDGIPKFLNAKIKRMAKLALSTSKLQREIDGIFISYGIDPNVFYATADKEPQTEAMACIINAEEDVESSIREIEEIFLYYINREEESSCKSKQGS